MEMWKALVLVLVSSSPAVAQTVEVKAKPLTDADVQLIRQDVQAQKTQIITDTMTFTESEAAAFWPVYKEYAAEQQAIATKRWNVVVDYAQNIEKMDDQKAHDLSQRMFAIDDEIQGLRKRYYPRFEKALGAKRAAKFYQVDNRLSLIVNLQLSSEIPLIPQLIAVRACSSPHMVTGGNVQIVWKKFMLYCDVEPRIVPWKPRNHRLPAQRLEKYLDENTICVVAIAGSTFTGEDDGPRLPGTAQAAASMRRRRDSTSALKALCLRMKDALAVGSWFESENPTLEIQKDLDAFLRYLPTLWAMRSV